MTSVRKQRLQEGLRAELSEVIRREMRDPRLREGLLSITDVEVSQDYKHAVVYISVLGDEAARAHALAALKGASGLMRGELGRRKSFISVPELQFRYDESMDRGTRVVEVLQQLRHDDALRAAEQASEAAAPASNEAAE